MRSAPRSIAVTASCVPVWTCRIRSPLARAATARLLANLAGHHGKAESVLAGPRRLDSSVEREQVGLIGDVVDRVHYIADALAKLPKLLHVRRRDAHHAADLVHAGHGLADSMCALLGGLPRLTAGCRTSDASRATRFTVAANSSDIPDAELNDSACDCVPSATCSTTCSS